MARSFQKNEKASGNLDFVLVSNRRINVSKALLQVAQSRRLKFPVGERELLDDSDCGCTRYGGLLQVRACSRDSNSNTFVCACDKNNLTSPLRAKLVFSTRCVGRTEGHCKAGK